MHDDSKQIPYGLRNVEYCPLFAINIIGIDDEVSQFVQFQASIIHFHQGFYSSWSPYSNTDMRLFDVLDVFGEFEMSCKELCDISFWSSVLFEDSALVRPPRHRDTESNQRLVEQLGK